MASLGNFACNGSPRGPDPLLRPQFVHGAIAAILSLYGTLVLSVHTRPQMLTGPQYHLAGDWLAWTSQGFSSGSQDHLSNTPPGAQGVFPKLDRFGIHVGK